MSGIEAIAAERRPALDEQGVRGVALGLLMAEGYLEPARED